MVVGAEGDVVYVMIYLMALSIFIQVQGLEKDQQPPQPGAESPSTRAELLRSAKAYVLLIKTRPYSGSITRVILLIGKLLMTCRNSPINVLSFCACS